MAKSCLLFVFARVVEALDVDLSPRQLQGLPSGCTAACPEMIEAYAAAIRAQALEDPTEAMKAVHQQMCLHQAYRCLAQQPSCSELEGHHHWAQQVECSCHACPSFNPGYPILANLALSMREQFQRDNATQEILCPMVGPAKCAVAKDACQIFDGVTMDAVRGMESQCLQSGYLIEEDEDVSTTELETSASGREILSLFMVQLLQLTFVLGNVLISTSAVS